MGARPETKTTHRLYVWLPVKIVDQHQILSLHPRISLVYLPRQKSRRWCIITFNSASELHEVREALRKIKINNKRIKVKLYKKTKTE